MERLIQTKDGLVDAYAIFAAAVAEDDDNFKLILFTLDGIFIFDEYPFFEVAQRYFDDLTFKLDSLHKSFDLPNNFLTA